jgi:hypothetical protein
MADLPRPQWIAAEQNRFGVSVLDLSPITLGVIATSSDPDNARRAVSWSQGIGEDLFTEGVALPEIRDVSLRYPADRPLPDGLLFSPSEMEEKWVIALRGDTIRAARSWTGAIGVEAAIERRAGEIAVTELRFTDDSPFAAFGDPVDIFDWFVRSHALGDKLPMPISDEGAARLEESPAAAFAVFGNKLICAARAWDPPPPTRPLRSDGAALVATRAGDGDRLRELAAAGEPIDAPTTFNGYTPLYLAVIRDDVGLATALLDLGADPNRRADRGAVPLIVAVVEGAGRPMLDLLAARGADTAATNDDGFGSLHAVAETDQPEALGWLVGRGADLEARTRHGHTPLQIAAALGHLRALEALVAAGADLDAEAGGATARDIAEAEGQGETVALIDRLRG